MLLTYSERERIVTAHIRHKYNHCVRALVTSGSCRAVLIPFLLHGGRSPRLSAREEVGSPHLPKKTKKNYQLSAGLGGWAESAGLLSTSHPPTLSHRPPCTHALCTRLHKTQYPLDTKCLCSRACDLWLVPCCSYSFSSPRGKISSPQRQRGGGLPAPPPSTPEPA